MKKNETLPRAAHLPGAFPSDEFLCCPWGLPLAGAVEVKAGDRVWRWCVGGERRCGVVVFVFDGVATIEWQNGVAQRHLMRVV